MRTRSWRWYAVSVALLAVHVSMSALGTIGMCVDRPHTHGGVPAPDCVMYHPQPGTPPDASYHNHRHHQDNESSTDTARLACSCSADLVTLLTTEIAVVPGSIGMAVPLLATTPPLERTTPAPDMRPAPLSPPPRPSLS
jgi:hypothetical protein